MTYAEFDEIAKRAFVQQSLGELDAKGRKINVSRVAVRTGLSRKEVARIKQLIDLKSGAVGPQETVRPARVLQIWHSEAGLLNDSGVPIDLPFDEGTPSFSELVRRVGGDVPAGAVRAELLAAEAIVELPNGKLRALKRFFVPATLDEDLVIGFDFIVAPLLESFSHNIEDPASALIQRVAYSDHLSPEALVEFKRVSHEQAEALIDSIDRWVSRNESGEAQACDGSKRAGLGVFYFESKPDVP